MNRIVVYKAGGVSYAVTEAEVEAYQRGDIEACVPVGALASTEAGQAVMERPPLLLGAERAAGMLGS